MQLIGIFILLASCVSLAVAAARATLLTRRMQHQMTITAPDNADTKILRWSNHERGGVSIGPIHIVLGAAISGLALQGMLQLKDWAFNSETRGSELRRAYHVVAWVENLVGTTDILSRPGVTSVVPTVRARIQPIQHLTQINRSINRPDSTTPGMTALIAAPDQTLYAATEHQSGYCRSTTTHQTSQPPPYGIAISAQGNAIVRIAWVNEDCAFPATTGDTGATGLVGNYPTSLQGTPEVIVPISEEQLIYRDIDGQLVLIRHTGTTLLESHAIVDHVEQLQMNQSCSAERCSVYISTTAGRRFSTSVSHKKKIAAPTAVISALYKLRNEDDAHG